MRRASSSASAKAVGSGRVFAFEFAMLTLTQSISIFAAGYMLDNVGMNVRQVTLVMAGVGVVVFLIWLAFYLHNRSQVSRRGSISQLASSDGPYA